MTTRANGFYWVRFDQDWTVAKWTNDNFDGFHEDDFHEIDETPIVRFERLEIKPGDLLVVKRWCPSSCVAGKASRENRLRAA